METHIEREKERVTCVGTNQNVLQLCGGLGGAANQQSL